MTEEQQLAAIEFVVNMKDSDRLALSTKAIQKKRDVYELIMFIASQESIGLWFANPIRRQKAPPTTILLEDDGDLHTCDDEEAKGYIKGSANPFSTTSKYYPVIGPDAGTSYDKMAYWKRQEQYAAAWAAFKAATQGDQP